MADTPRDRLQSALDTHPAATYVRVEVIDLRAALSPDARLREAAQGVMDAWDAQGYIGNDDLVGYVAAPMRVLRAALGEEPIRG